jgi:hypothetical protein
MGTSRGTSACCCICACSSRPLRAVRDEDRPSPTLAPPHSCSAASLADSYLAGWRLLSGEANIDEARTPKARDLPVRACSDGPVFDDARSPSSTAPWRRTCRRARVSSSTTHRTRRPSRRSASRLARRSATSPTLCTHAVARTNPSEVPWGRGRARERHRAPPPRDPREEWAREPGTSWAWF